MITTSRDSWLVIPEPKPKAAVQLVCLPNAGGGIATFSGWFPQMPSWIELALAQLPGRDARRHEPFCRTIGELADGLANHLRRDAGRPRILFGHSMGALVAFETARRLAGPSVPKLLVVAGRRAPSAPETRSPISHLPFDEFVSITQQRYGGIPDVVLQDPDLLALLMPAFRGDLACVETYRYEPNAPLTCPIVAYGGVTDEHAPIEMLDAWRRETQSSFHVRYFTAGHFFVRSMRDQVISTLLADITGVCV
jgi:medium-chain acyl-[acyl-carrier-protein] hydrolase